ncbi:SH3 domain-containing protein [bacterium]|nr:SH3 domain-containing protein [bacterium]
MIVKRYNTIFLLSVMVFLTVCGSVIWSQKSKPRHAPDTLDGVEPEMLSPGYWIALQPDADEIIMTSDEIAAFNERVRSKHVVFRDYFGKPDPLENDFELTQIKGPVMNPLLPIELPDTLPGDSLRVRLGKNIEWLYSRDFYDNRNAIYSDTMRREIVNDMNIDAVPDIITRRFGIVVNHSNVRHYPTAVPGYSDTQWELDMFQATALLIGNPVAVIHQSADGDFLYIESPVTRGWVPAENIALADRETVRALTDDRNFLMATGHRIPVYGDPAFSGFARYLYFSAIMPLIRQDKGGYTVKMPYRRPDGSLGVANGYIRPDADVHKGYLPYTKRNVITQAFKLLNQPYGWADQDNKRSCAGTMRVLLRCFGIKTGRHPSFILSASDHQFYIDPSLSTEEKMARVAALEPVITMAGNYGHIVLYLGRARNGKLYYFHQAGWGYDDENGDHVIVNRTTLNPLDHPWYDVHRANVYTTFRKQP